MTTTTALSNRQLLRAALVVLAGFLTSGILGLIRTAVFSATFGTSAQLDAFYAAQRIPEMLFTLVAGGALGSSFLPIFSRYLHEKDPSSAWRLASAVMTLSALAAILLALVLVILAPFIVPRLLVPGRSLEEQTLTIALTQLMLITTAIFSISGLTMSILNAHQIFFLPALAASMYNLGQIAGALILARMMPASEGVAQVNGANIYGLAWGAVLGALLHLAIQLPALPRIQARLTFLLAPRFPGVREVLLLMGPRVLGLAVVQINFAVNVAFASVMLEGSLTALNTAWVLMFFALGVIGQSMGTALFPSLSALAAQGNFVGFRDRLSGALRAVLFLAFPASVGLIVLGQPIIAVMFERGQFTAESTAATAWALSFFAIGIAGHALLEVLSRAFYALSDTWTPVRIGLASMVSNIILSYVFIQFIGDPDSLIRGPFAGLALSNSLTTLLEGVALWWLMQRKMHKRLEQQLESTHDVAVLSSAGRALIAALGMGAAVWGTTQVLSEAHVMITVIAGIGVGVVAFFGLALLLGVEEAHTVPRLLLRR
ncbi:MAG: murein biosynthesis integral membrane protein MurJ [bacterium]|nr:murein biosynthesis integral membrane protein MurJ [bacterium]